MTGTRVSRAASYDAVGDTGAVIGAGVGATAGAGAGAWAGVAAAWTSSRVMMPSGPDGVTVVRSTPRSLASLRTGGLASGRDCTVAAGLVAAGLVAAGLVAAGPWPFSSVWIATDACWTGTSGPLRGRRLVEEAATP
ncbi:UNVERIFIED_CONTAM: hypothetical protein RKD50_004872 [Streptomyces canus]